MRRRKSKKAKLFGIVFPVAVVNLVVFGLVALALGGLASIGQSDGGHYFVGNHGKLTEVSRATFIYSLIHTYVSFALVLLCVGLGAKRQRPKTSA